MGYFQQRGMCWNVCDTSLEYCVKFRSPLSRTDTAVLHMGDIHSRSPITWPPSMCLSSHIVSGKSHAMHHMNRKSSVWETWTTQMASECAVHAACSSCTRLPKTGRPYGTLHRETDTAKRVQSCCMYIFHLSFGFQVVWALLQSTDQTM